ncbi:PREDICTED: intraflagellar transport protein 46 homolog [Nicrophorus vespilloides]|uniref:Intraflagellar transport protein 46 homolog n=1 Tax=Nicrophorus vespilloides TaxID=110193 RepID=A0ABM1NIH6_NICVS|nr:PREDICTED: intraflagellar transport protein 46 homolog [Nicrophorus vespilloides]
MARKELSFSIVDDDDVDDDEVFELEGNDAIPIPNGADEPRENRKSAMNRTQQVSKEYDSSDESHLSPHKKLPQMQDVSNLSNILAGPSSGRQTVTKIRPPQLAQLSSESESEDSDLIERRSSPKSSILVGEYDPKSYDHLDVNADIKELFQYITKYVPQHLGQDYKFKPFVPDFIPAVGDIDAFLKVIAPEVGINGEASTVDQSDLGLVVLDEPAANQSDPAVLHLQLRASSINVGNTTDMVIKKVDNLEKNSKTVDKWIKDISDLHRSKSSPIFKYSDPMPELDDLMEEWPENMENLLKIHGFPSYTMQGPLSRYIDIVCCLFDIPVYPNKIQSLHLLFSLYAAVKTSNLYRANNGGNKSRNIASGNTESNDADQLVLE